MKGKRGGGGPRSPDAPRFSYRDKRAMIARGDITRDTSCTSKTRYTAGGAVGARLAMKRKRKKVKIYHCNFCNGYHLTSVGT